MKPWRILLADDHAVVIEGLRRILDRPEFEVVGVADDGCTLLQAAIRLQPDVIVCDIVMPSLNGIEATRKIHAENLKPKIIFLTMRPESAYASAAFAAGASGYVLKSDAGEDLIVAISEALNGRTYISKQIAAERGKDPDGLTRRQREVLQCLAKGLQTKEIAAMMALSSRTVEFHKYRLMETLGARSVADLTRYAVKHGIIE